MKINSYPEKATYFIALIICAVIPFIAYPLPPVLMKEINYLSDWDLFAYYKSVSTHIISIIAACVFITYISASRDKPNIIVNFCFTLFILWAAISTLFATNHNTGFWGKPQEYQGLLAYLEYFIIFLLVSNTFDLCKINGLIRVTLISSSFMAIFCLCEFFGFDIVLFFLNPDQTEHFQSSTIVHATFGNSNFVGSFFSLMVPLAVVSYFRAYDGYFLNQELFFLILNFAGLIVSMSRIALVSVLITLTIIFLSIKKDNFSISKLAMVITLILSFIFVLNYATHSRINNHYSKASKQINLLISGKYRSFGSGRIYLYEKCMRTVVSSLKNMLVGVGPDCLIYYESGSDEDKNKPPELKGGIMSKAHSEPIEYAVTMGIPALLFYLGFIASILIPCMKKIKTASPEISGLFAAWLGYLIQSFFNPGNIGIVSIFIVFSAILYKSVMFPTKVVNP